MKYKHAILIVLAVLIIDQLSKIYIKTHFAIGEFVNILGDWSKIYFIENEGMAFGFTLSDAAIGKLILTLFRLVAVVFGFFYLNTLIKKKHKTGLIVFGALILAGAAGNLIDSLFYGMIFSESSMHTVAQFVPWGQGYGSFFHGNVVDMLYFPMIDTTWPDWMPIWGGKPFRFFEPIFNVADVSISTGVIGLLVFQKKLLPHSNTRKDNASNSENAAA